MQKPRAIVAIIPTDRLRTDLYKSTPVDAQGRFSIRGIAPGEYKVFAWQAVTSGMWTSMTAMKPFEQFGIDAVVEEGTVLRNLTVTQIDR